MYEKFKQIYYSDSGYWRGKSAIQKLAKKVGTTIEEAENGYSNSLFTKYIYHHQNTSLDLMRVCHCMLHQMISIRQTSSIYHMTSSKRKHTSIL